MALMDSPRSVDSDTEAEMSKVRFLQKAMAEQSSMGTFGSLSGLESPDYGRYTPRAGLSTRNVKRYSLISTSSESSLSPAWRAPAFSSPKSSSTTPTAHMCPFSVTLGDDDAMSPSASPLDNQFKKSERWAALTPRIAHSTQCERKEGKTASSITTWSTLATSTPSGSSSTENTENLSFFALSSPFKVTPLSTSTSSKGDTVNIENIAFRHSIATDTPQMRTKIGDHENSILTPTTDPSTTQSHLSIHFSSTESPSADHFADHNGENLIPNLDSPSTTNIGCLVDLNESSITSKAIEDDEETRTIRLERVNKQFADFGIVESKDPLENALDANNTFIVSNSIEKSTSFSISRAKEEEDSLDMSLSETTISRLAYPSKSSFGERENVENVETKAQHESDERKNESEISPQISELKTHEEGTHKYSREMTVALFNVLCDKEADRTSPKWLRPIRPLFTFEDLLVLVLRESARDVSQQTLLDETLMNAMETGQVEAIDLQEDEYDDDQKEIVTRLYRASAEMFSSIVSH